MSRRPLNVEEQRRRRHRSLVYVILATLPFYFCGIVLLVGFSGRGGDPGVSEVTETPTETIAVTPSNTPGGPTLTVAATLTLPATPTQMTTPTRTPTPNLDATATIRVLLTQGANSLTATAISATEQVRGTATAAVEGTQTAQAQATATANAIASATADARTTEQANRPPIAENDQATTQEGQPVSINVLANDLDPNEGQTLTITGVQRPTEQGGDVECADGVCTYRPPEGFTGRDRFTYTVSDPLGASSNARVTVQVEERPNTPPDAVNDEATTTRNTEVQINVLANDSDPDGDPLEIVDFDDETDEDGEVECEDNGICTYTPPDDFTGEDVFAYTISDGRGGMDTALVDITVTDD